jgi:bifunctional oligoribonuclease and PAP phosphatase NrnA
MTISVRQWQAAAAAIRDAGSVVVSCHLHPDGDALGSALALHLALTRQGRQAVVSFSEPFVVAPTYRFLPGVDALTPPGQIPTDADLFVCFDTGSKDRLGTLTAAADGARQVMVIDHHASNTNFGDVNLIDPAAPASAVLCRELLRHLDLPLDRDVATCLYTGLVTDTGRFAYQATTADTHRLAAELLEAGVRPYEVAKAIFETNPIGYLRLLGDVLGRIRTDREASLVWASVTLADLARHGVGMEETEGLIDVVRTDAASEAAAVFKEQPDGTWKVSLRSKGRVDVGAIAEALGGGGHRFAAGFTTGEDLDAAVKSVHDALTA